MERDELNFVWNPQTHSVSKMKMILSIFEWGIGKMYAKHSWKIKCIMQSKNEIFDTPRIINIIFRSTLQYLTNGMNEKKNKTRE